MAKGYVPGGIGEAAHVLRGKLSTGIQKGNNCYFLVGSIPAELTQPSTHGTPQWPPLRVSQRWDTLEEAIAAVKSTGIIRFQLPDYSWYKEAQ